ncbi:hypothetical protein PR048_031179 [Dryococelus australis]|uniref:Uncharacterized protein n=1 Tax=Dryococelus australis TaxID=614101 RepID=A0ABQ9G5A1_9NEOP|nr:hypothetical protein PR048_031179 [Dryococelus australis]
MSALSGHHLPRRDSKCERTSEPRHLSYTSTSAWSAVLNGRYCDRREVGRQCPILHDTCSCTRFLYKLLQALVHEPCLSDLATLRGDPLGGKPRIDFVWSPLQPTSSPTYTLETGSTSRLVGSVLTRHRTAQNTGHDLDVKGCPNLPISSGTIHACEGRGVAPTGIGPGSPGWGASGLSTTPPRPHALQDSEPILGSPLVDERPIMNGVKYRVVSGVVWTNRTMVSSNTDTNRTGVLAVQIGVAVAERLALPPPTKANRVQYPAGSPDIRMWESCRTMPFVGGFSRGSPVSFRRLSLFTSITLTDSEDLAVKSRPNLFTSLNSKFQKGSYATTGCWPRLDMFLCPVPFTIRSRKLDMLGSPLVDDQPIMNAVKYRIVSGVVWTNRTMVSSNTDTNRTGVFAVRSEVSMEQRRNARSGETGDPRGNPPTSEFCMPTRPGRLRAISILARIQVANPLLPGVSGTGMMGRGKRDTPEKTRRPAASSGTIPICENPVARLGIEPGSPWWEASVLIAQ